MLQLFGRRLAVLRLKRYEEADDHPSQRGVHAGFQHRRPQHHPHEDVDTDAAHIKDVQQRQHRNRSGSHAQRQDRQIAGVEQRDNHNGAKIIDDRQRHQEDFQRNRHAASQQGQHPERKSDIRRGRDRPAVTCNRILPGERQEEQRRHHHPTERGNDRERRALAAGKRAQHQLTLNFKPHQQEEHRHQRIVDPQQHVLVNFQRPDLQLNGRFQKCMIEIPRDAKISQHHRGRCGNNQEHATGRLTAKETV